MPEQKDVPRSAADRGPLPPRRELLASEKEDLVERVETLHHELQRRLELEEEILHLNFQKGTASLQAQVEEASRRYKNAQMELEAFRAEVLESEDPSKVIPRPYVYQDLEAPPAADPGQLRTLMTVYRRLRSDRDRLQQEIERVRADVASLTRELEGEKAKSARAAQELSSLQAASSDLQSDAARLRHQADLAREESDLLRRELLLEKDRASRMGDQLSASQVARTELESVRDRLQQDLDRIRLAADDLRREADAERAKGAKAAEEAAALQISKAALETDHARVTEALSRSEAELSALRMEEAQVRDSLSLERETSGRNSAEAAQLRERLADAERRLEEATKPPPPAAAEDGEEPLQKFLQKVRLRPLLDKSVPAAARPGQPSAPSMVYESIVAIIGAQDCPLEAARDLPFRIVRAARKPDLAELRQFIESAPDAVLNGAARVHDQIRASLVTPSKKGEIVTVDVDSFEMVLGARPRAFQSYWPIVCYAPELREFWHGELRLEPKDEPKDMAAFVSEALSRTPSALDKSRLRFRLDVRCFGEPMLRLLEGKRCSFAIAVPDSPELRAAARGCSFSPLADGWEAGMYSGKLPAARSVRVAVLRHPRDAQRKPGLRYGFRDPQYAYYAFAVDKSLAPEQALECVAARTSAEEAGHALLRDFTANRLLGRGAKSHAACFQLYLFASNLLIWMKAGIK